MKGRANPRSRGKRRKPRPTLFPAEPFSLAAQIERHLSWLEVRGYAEATLVNRRRDLVLFGEWCAERAITVPAELSRPVLDSYQRWVAHIVKPNGDRLSVKTQRHKLQAVAGLCSWLTRERLILYNPASEMEMPKPGIHLPHAVLTIEEVEKVMAVPNITTTLGLRDRAILETLYGTGIRRAELARLEVPDLDLNRAAMIIRQGKGKKDRYLPLGERAMAWLNAYLENARPELVVPPDEGILFLSADGTILGLNYLSGVVRKIIDKANLSKTGSCHLLRHTMATLMLEGGADLRYIQQMLGHAKVETTQIYTRVSIEALRAVHAATHPGSSLKREEEAAKGEKASSPRILLDVDEDLG